MWDLRLSGPLCPTPWIKRVTDGHLPVIPCYQGGDRELSVLIKLSRREGRGEVNPSLSILLIYLTYWAHLIPPPPPPLMISCLTCKVKVPSPLAYTCFAPFPPFQSLNSRHGNQWWTWAKWSASPRAGASSSVGFENDQSWMMRKSRMIRFF